MRTSASAKPRGIYVPSELALHYAAQGFEVVDDLTPNKVLVIPRAHSDQPVKVVRDGP